MLSGQTAASLWTSSSPRWAWTRPCPVWRASTSTATWPSGQWSGVWQCQVTWTPRVPGAMTTAASTAGAAGGRWVTTARCTRPVVTRVSTPSGEMRETTRMFTTHSEKAARARCVVTIKMAITPTPWERTTRWRLSTHTGRGPQSWHVWWTPTTNPRPATEEMDQWESPPILWIMSITCERETLTRSDAFQMSWAWTGIKFDVKHEQTIMLQK